VVVGGACAAGAVAAWAATVASSQIYGETVRHTDDASTLALTFDDGPNPGVTPALLDMLDRFQAKGTFFVVGKHVRAFPDLTAEIAKRGHTIGNHTDSHPALSLCSPERTREELARCEAAIGEAAEVTTRWMRPPYGYRSPWLDGIVRKRFRSRVVMWSRMAQDWKFTDAEPVIRRLRRVKGGDIVVLHDGDHRVLEGNRRHIVTALEYWIPRWKDAGLRFPSMDEVRASSEATDRA
jgi:peptidoglycan-N-acetylglucosamine deacetylase